MDGECLGRSRGGLSSKLHLAVDGRGLPLSVIITAGQDGDNPQLLPLLDQIRVPRPGPGRPRTRPDAVLADKAYSHPSTRAALRARRVRFTSPERADQIAVRHAKGPRGGRPPPSTSTGTSNATSSNDASTGLNSSATSPPATPNAPPTSAPRSSSPPPSSGSDDLQDRP